VEKRSLTRSLIYLYILNLLLLNILLVTKLSLGLTLLLMTLSTGSILIFHLTNCDRQLRKILNSLRRISKGELHVTIPDLNVKEFDEVGKSINMLLDQKDNTIGHLAAHREELRLLLSSNEDPLWAQDDSGFILWANNSFYELFHKPSEKSKQQYWEIIREPFLLEFLKEYKPSEQKELREFTIEDHYYLLSAASDESGKKRVFMLQSIDELRAAQQMKRDFIVNLAHEFRTPLTAIKGFSEALRDDDSQKERYLNIIQNHTQRLIRLIADLEELIRLERGFGLSIQEVDLAEFMANLRLIIQPMTDEAKLELKITVSKDIKAYFDPFKLEQVFINLAQNSIRHTQTGGITISAKQVSDKIQFDFSDTGEGIDPKDHHRIFERFWVGDSSRNRARGGTGLGLSIVKHIIALHGGKISVDSFPGQGCHFQIIIPQNVVYGDAWH